MKMTKNVKSDVGGAVSGKSVNALPPQRTVKVPLKRMKMSDAVDAEQSQSRDGKMAKRCRDK